MAMVQELKELACPSVPAEIDPWVHQALAHPSEAWVRLT